MYHILCFSLYSKAKQSSLEKSELESLGSLSSSRMSLAVVVLLFFAALRHSLGVLLRVGETHAAALSFSLNSTFWYIAIDIV
jgi:hypothetical protein